MKWTRILAMVLVLGFVVGCSQDDPMGPDNANVTRDKDGTETLGPIDIMDGSGFAEGGVGMVGLETGMLDIEVPAGATVKQVFLYWMGGSTDDIGDDTISVDGNMVTGALIGGPTNFYENMNFRAYRADVTAEGWVVPGANSFEIGDFDFDFTGNTHDENNGAGMLVIYEMADMTADLQLRDGLDMAFFKFSPTLDAIEPLVFNFDAEGADRTAQLVVLAGSVGENRPNQIVATTSAGDQVWNDPLGSMDGPLFDTITLDVTIPAGDTSVTINMYSVASEDPLGASLGVIGTALGLPTTPPDYCIGDYVWYDANRDGCQDPDEMPAEGVEVNLWIGCPPAEVIATTYTDAEGLYEFCGLQPGDYTVQFVAPEGYEFCEQYSSACDPETDSNAGSNGITDCVTIVDADDYTIDAALCEIPEEGCTYTIGKWKNWTGLGNGNQADIVTPLLPVWLGDEGGAKSLAVTTVEMAVDVLSQHVYGHPSNAITKLYAQMLAAKLNVANGASDDAIADYLDDADAFLADYDYTDWNSLSKDMKDDVRMWHSAFGSYNEGTIGPGHCDDRDDGDDYDDLRWLVR